MKGSYRFRVKSKKIIFEFSIRRNITVIRGESASGKTTLLHMMYEYRGESASGKAALLHMVYEYLRIGRESGYSVSADSSYYVYLRKEVGRSWQDALYPLKNTIIFIEENNPFVFSKEFAEFVRKSGNYVVLVNRSPFKMLPYSIHEIYEIVTDAKHADVRESYHELKELYSNYPVAENNRADIVVTEDSNSGYQFFSSLFWKKHVVSAAGNSSVPDVIQDLQGGDVLVIADGAAFGAVIENCLEYISARTGQRISIWMPESFEYLILKSGLIKSEELHKILESIPDYVDSGEYESWERYFTQFVRICYWNRVSSNENSDL